MRARTAKQAFYHSIPVMAGYIVLGTGFGILLRSAGYGVGWAFAMSLLIFAGSLQFVGVGLISGGASVARFPQRMTPESFFSHLSTTVPSGAISSAVAGS